MELIDAIPDRQTATLAHRRARLLTRDGVSCPSPTAALACSHGCRCCPTSCIEQQRGSRARLEPRQPDHRPNDWHQRRLRVAAAERPLVSTGGSRRSAARRPRPPIRLNNAPLRQCRADRSIPSCRLGMEGVPGQRRPPRHSILRSGGRRGGRSCLGRVGRRRCDHHPTPPAGTPAGLGPRRYRRPPPERTDQHCAGSDEGVGGYPRDTSAKLNGRADRPSAGTATRSPATGHRQLFGGGCVREPQRGTAR